MDTERVAFGTRESIKVGTLFADRVRELAAKRGWSLAEALERVISTGCRELEFPLAAGEAAVVRAFGNALCHEGAPFELRVGLEQPEESELYVSGAKHE